MNDAPRDGLVSVIELVTDDEVTWFGDPCAKLPDTHVLDITKTTPRRSTASATMHLLLLFIVILPTLFRSELTGFPESISSSSPVLRWFA